MRRKEVILQSPLRILDRAIGGGLGKGHLGVVVAPAGAGKSACLVHLGLDALLRDRPVLHVAVGQPIEHVAARYDALFDELAERVDLLDRGGVRESIAHRRLIWSFAEGAFGARGFEEALAAFEEHLALGPSVLLVDGFDWEGAGSAETIRSIQATAGRVGAGLWMTARGRPDAPPAGPDAADVVLRLEPHGEHAHLRLARPAAEVALVLEGGTLRLLRRGEAAEGELSPGAFTLFATGSTGAEEEFGACAERWGVGEVNFTFGGRAEAGRTRGLVALSDDELKLGEVSAAYVKAHLHRTFADPRVLQAIWHQVSTAGEVFAVGTLNPDKTAHGGTGWAVELARHWGKPVHLFDQERSGWVRWDGQDWVEAPPPVVTRPRFAGAGTRSPSDCGRAAIRGLFERSFGAAP
jgi:hypothetical protein